MTEISVGMARYAVGEAPDVLVCKGIGSCIVVTMYDPSTKIGGLLHSMLPEAKGDTANPAKYVDIGMKLLLDEMRRAGAKIIMLKVKIAGGADMFPTLKKPEKINVGIRNILVAQKTFEALGLKNLSEDVGGTHGRSIRFSLSTGIVEVSKRI